jgi:hypothetical protein
MPDEALRQRFEAVVNSAAEPLVRQYLEEAYRCFVAEAFNAAVVMTWNAVACYLRLVVRTISVDLFRDSYKTLHRQEPGEDLSLINDSLFMQACDGAGILCDVVPDLHLLRKSRNDCAHPTGIFVSVDEALELAESIGHVVSRRVVEERLTNPAILRKFARNASEPDAEGIAKWVREDLCPQLAHDLLTIFERDDFERDDEVTNVSGIIGLWRGLWNRVDEATRQRLWNRIERIVQNTLRDVERALRTPEELVRLIVWPAPDAECPPRDRIGELFVTWLEGLFQSGQFRDVDKELAYGLRGHLPASLRDRVDELLVTWLEGLVQSGRFEAKEMEFARELRRQDLPATLRERSRATLQEMVRRYAE